MNKRLGAVVCLVKDLIDQGAVMPVAEATERDKLIDDIFLWEPFCYT